MRTLRPDHGLSLHLELVRLTRGIGWLRLAIAGGVERLEVLGGVQKLGFPGVDAYARERLGRSGRWVGDARTLTRRLEGMPRLREAYLSGRLSTSKVELLARHLVRGDQIDGLDEEEAIVWAASLTVRELRRRLGGRAGDLADDERLRWVQLTRHVERLDAVAFEGAIRLMQALGETTRSRAIEGLLAEGLTTLLNRAELPPDLLSRLAGPPPGTVGAPLDADPDVATLEPETDVGPAVQDDLALGPELRTPTIEPAITERKILTMIIANTTDDSVGPHTSGDTDTSDTTGTGPHPEPGPMSVSASSNDATLGIVPLRLTLPDDLAAFWCDLELLHADAGFPMGTFVAFLVASTLDSWRGLTKLPACGDIYLLPARPLPLSESYLSKPHLHSSPHRLPLAQRRRRSLEPRLAL